MMGYRSRIAAIASREPRITHRSRRSAPISLNILDESRDSALYSGKSWLTHFTHLFKLSPGSSLRSFFVNFDHEHYRFRPQVDGAIVSSFTGREGRFPTQDGVAASESFVRIASNIVVVIVDLMNCAHRHKWQISDCKQM
jgi:hypothetical protein